MSRKIPKSIACDGTANAFFDAPTEPCLRTQITIFGSTAGSVEVRFRPVLPTDSAAHTVSEYEGADDNVIDLTASPAKRTIVFSAFDISGLMFIPTGTGACTIYVTQTGY